MKIIESILTRNPCYTAGRKITVRGLMLHSIGCPQPSAMVFVRNWNRESYRDACVHGFIDGNTGEVYQTLPWDHRGWHAGGGANNTHIGVEMCEPSSIRYAGGASFTVSDWDDATACVKRTYQTAVELFAWLCQKFGLDPLADGVIISHREGHERGVASNHADPEHLWTQLKTGCTMNGFRRDVAEAMGREVPVTPTPAPKEREETVNMELRMLKRGMSGNDVRAAMLLMQDKGYYPDAIPATDKLFGPKMDAGVRKMQKEHNLGVDGIIGKNSWTYLLKG